MGKTEKHRSLFVLHMLALFILMFLCRFLLFADKAPVNIEECHSGAVARELIDNGLRFPIEQYSPEYYENSLILGSFLTVIPARIFGVVPFALEIVPFMFAFGCLLIGCALLRRSGHGTAIWFFSLFFMFFSQTFFSAMHDSVGNHIIGLFFCMLIMYQYYRFVTGGGMLHFHAFLFFAGLGLSVHLAVALYISVCIAAYYLLLKQRRDGSEYPLPAGKQLYTGAACLSAGLLPFFFFFVKTKGLSVLYMLTVVSSKKAAERPFSELAAGFLRGAVSSISIIDSLSYLLLIVFAASVVVLLTAEKRKIRWECYALLHLLCLLVPASALAVFVFSGGGRNLSYFPYMLMPLYMLAAMALSVSAKKAAKHGRLAGIALYILVTVAFLQPMRTAKYVINFSPRHAYNELFGNGETAYCYWRFGHAFANFTKYERNPGDFILGVKSKCDRLSGRRKRDECFYGGIGGFELLTPRITGMFGPEDAGIVAQGFGFWLASPDECFSRVTSPPYVDECILGFIGRNATTLHTERPGGNDPRNESLFSIPCLPRQPEFSGLNRTLRARARGGTIESEARKCGNPGKQKDTNYEDLNRLCATVIGYCGAVDGKAGACGLLSYSDELKKQCEDVYIHVADSLGN